MKTLDDLEKDAGKDLAKLITTMIRGDEAIGWFYNCKVEPFNNKTPFEYAQKEGPKMLYSRLMANVLGSTGL